MIARLCVPSPHFGLPKPKGNEGGSQLLWDERLAPIAPREIFAFAQSAIEECTRNPKVIIEKLEMALNHHCQAVSNSLGISKAAGQCTLSWSVMGVAKDGEQVSSFDFDGATVANPSSIQEEIQRSMGAFRESVSASLGARTGKTYRGAVLFHPYAVLDLLGDFISQNCTGQRHQDGMSSWKGKLGAQVASPNLTVFEDPHSPNRPAGWSPFDREGVPTSQRQLIQNGKLNFLAYHTFSARREGVEPTGNAIGGARSLPGVGFQNLTFQPSGMVMKNGISDSDALIAGLKEGLLLKRFSGNLDATSGEFSGVAKNSFWIHDGLVAFPVQEVMVAGNLFDCLKQIGQIGSEVFYDMAGNGAPYMTVEGISVTAGK